MTNRSALDVRARVNDDVAYLFDAIRQAALAAVEGVLRRGEARTVAPRLGLQREKAGSRMKAGGKKKANRLDGGGVRAGGVLPAIQAAGEPVRSETLAGALGASTQALKPALDELVASRRVRREGHGRGTTFGAS